MSQTNHQKVDHTDLAEFLRLVALMIPILIEGRGSSPKIRQIIMNMRTIVRDGAQTSTESKRNILSEEEKLTLLSKKISKVNIFTSRLVNFFRGSGVIYIGEIFRIRIERPSTSKIEITTFLSDYGFDSGFDPIEYGWVPPYWQDEKFLDMLRQDLKQEGCNFYLDNKIEDLKREGITKLREYLAKFAKLRKNEIGEYRRGQDLLKSFGYSHIVHSAAFSPPL